MENSAELTGLFAYLQADDEARARWSAHATAMAFNGGGKRGRRAQVEDDEEVIDTTSPEFAKNFKGFTNTKMHAPQRSQRQPETQILLG